MEEQKPSKSTTSKITKSKKLPVFLGVGFLALVLIVVGFVFISSKHDKDQKASKGPVVFTIEGQEYRENEINALTRYPTEVLGVYRDDAMSQAFDAYKAIEAGKKLGVTPSDEEIQQVKTSLLSPDIVGREGYKENYEKWFDLVAQQAAINRYVGGEFAPTYKGYLLVFSSVNGDDSYAKERAGYYLGQLQSSQIKPEDALSQVQGDPTLKSIGFPTIRFGKSDQKTWEEEIGDQTVVGYVKDQKKIGVAGVGTGKVSGSNENFYYLVILEEFPTAKVVSTTDYTDTLKSLSATHYGFKLSSENDGTNTEGIGQ